MDNTKKEYGELIGNLNELNRRIFDPMCIYSKDVCAICANWFVDTLSDLLLVDEYKSCLTYEQVEKFYTMGINILETKLLDGKDGERLIKHISELARMKELLERDYLMVL